LDILFFGTDYTDCTVRNVLLGKSRGLDLPSTAVSPGFDKRILRGMVFDTERRMRGWKEAGARIFSGETVRSVCFASKSRVKIKNGEDLFLSFSGP
jgi:hypothetical protein